MSAKWPCCFHFLEVLEWNWKKKKFIIVESVVHDASVQIFIILLWTVYGTWCLNTNVHNIATNSLRCMLHEYKCSQYCSEQSVICMNTHVHNVAINSLSHMMLEYKCSQYCYEQSVIHNAWTHMFIMLLWIV